MPVTYFTTDTAQWGAGKEADLTPAERDDNFFTVLTSLLAAETPGEAVVIQSITVTGDTFTVRVSDEIFTDTETETQVDYGPFNLPTQFMKWRDEWSALTVYEPFDVVWVAEDGVFLVTLDHTSAAAFNEAANSGTPNYDYHYIRLADLPQRLHGVVDVSAATYTVSSDDVRDILFFSAAVTVTLGTPTGFAAGEVVQFRQSGASATITIEADTTGTVNVPENRGNFTNYQGAMVTARYLGSGQWDLYGDLAVIA